MADLASEKELEDFLFNQKHNNNPLEIHGHVFRQVNIPGYGIIDLLYVDISAGPKPDLTVTIVELKLGKIDLNAVGQICRYKTAVDRYFRHMFSRHREYLDYVGVTGILVGKGYADGDVCFAVDNIDWLLCYHYDLDLSIGIQFKESSGWFHNDEDHEKLNRSFSEMGRKYLEMLKYCARSMRGYE